MLNEQQRKDATNKILNQIANAASQNLIKNPVAYKYAKSRGLTDKIISDFKIGLIPFEIKSDVWDTWLIKQAEIACPTLEGGDLLNILTSIGLLATFENKDGQLRVKSVFGNRLAIPYYDKDHKSIGFTTRKIDALTEEKDGFEAPKYLNSSESYIFKKSEKFFNYTMAKKALSNNAPLIMAEGELDTIAYTKSGCPAVACSGVALSDYQINLLKTLPTKNIILAYDNDLAGKEAMFNNYPALLKAGFNVSFVNYNGLPQKDADEIINDPTLGTNQIKKLYNNPQSEVSFLFDYFIHKATHPETHDEKTNKIIQKEIPRESLNDKDIFGICYNVFESLYKNHDYKVSINLKQELENYIASIFPSKLSIEEAHGIVKNFISLSTQKPERRYFRTKNPNKKRVIPKWDEFANASTIHMVLEWLGAAKGNGKNFYRSLWNPDSNASLSVKRNANVWSDFSAGRSGGIYQLIGYIDLTDPDHPVITDNPKQTSATQAYNWLIYKTNSQLPPAAEIDTVDSYSFSQEEKQRINNIENYFEKHIESKHLRVIQNLNHTSSPEEEKEFKQAIGEFEKDTPEQVENHNSSFFVQTREGSCPYKTNTVAHCRIKQNEGIICLPDSPSPVFLSLETNPSNVELVFIDNSWAVADSSSLSKNIKSPSFLIPQEYNKNILSQILKNNMVSINVINPSKEFVAAAFDQLSASKKQVFINGQDLYMYMTENYVLPFGKIVDSLIANNPDSLFKTNILSLMDKLHRDKSYSFKNVYKQKINKLNTKK